MSKIFKKVLVVGNPRSGTTSVTNMFKSIGLDVKHEEMGADGTSSCLFFRPADFYPVFDGGKFYPHGNDFPWEDYKFETRVHLIRHPLKTISSMRSICGTTHQEWWKAHGLIDSNLGTRDKLLKCMQAWIRTNLQIEEFVKPTHTVDILDMAFFIEEYFADLSQEVAPYYSNKSSGNRAAVPLTWKDLRSVDPALTAEINTYWKEKKDESYHSN